MVHHEFVLPTSAAEAFVAHRDGLMTFGPGLPGVGRVERIVEERRGSAERLVHRWFGDVSIMPRVVQRVVPQDKFTWSDDSVWDADELVGIWSISIDPLGDGPHLQGTHRFVDVPGGCKVVVSGDLLFAAKADTRLLGMRVGRIMAPVLDGAIRMLFRTIVDFSGSVIGRHMQRKAA